jgi:Protein of unknown function (DUF4011)
MAARSGDGTTGGPANVDALIRTAIRGWRDSLINLTGSNRLLNFKPSRAGAIEVTRPSPEAVLAELIAGRQFRFRSLAPRPDTDPDSAAPGAAGPTREWARDQMQAPTAARQRAARSHRLVVANVARPLPAARLRLPASTAANPDGSSAGPPAAVRPVGGGRG